MGEPVRVEGPLAVDIQTLRDAAALVHKTSLVGSALSRPLAAWLDSAAFDAAHIGSDPRAVVFARAVLEQNGDGDE